MSVGITEIEAGTTTRPGELAFHRDAEVVKVFTPFIKRLRRDGKANVRSTRGTMGGDVPAEGHGGPFRITALEEKQEDLSALNIEGAQPLIGGKDGIAEQPGVELS